MNKFKSVIKNPFLWISILIISVVLYSGGGFIIKTIVSILLLWGAYWISKFTGPYMKKRALHRTLDDMITRRTNWDGTLKSANQMYEINKVIGYIMPFVVAIIGIFSIWTTKPDKIEKNTQKPVDSSEKIESINETYEATNEVVSFNGEENVQEISAQNFEEGFPTPEYINTCLLKPETRDIEDFFSSLLSKGFINVELMEYSKDSIGSIIFEPGTAQAVVFINIYELEQRERYINTLNRFFNNTPNINIDYSGDGGIVVSYQY